MSTITSTGLGSGLDITDLVTKLVEAEKTPQSSLLTKQETTLNAKISALGSFKSAISSFQASLSALNRPSTFDTLSASSSNESILTASALSNADPGNYQIKVGQLASSHSLASASYANADDVIGTGSFTIQLGTYSADKSSFTANPDQGALTLNIDSTNNTLTGIRDAINDADAGVTAAVVYDGSGYRLAISSESGAANAMRISATSTDGLEVLNYNETDHDSATSLAQTQAAEDAELTINGLPVTSASNSVTKALKGVTLDLQQAQPDTTIKVSIKQDTSALTETLQSFVDAYNELQSTLKEVASYDVETQTASALFGDITVNSTMSKLRAGLNASVPGLTGSIDTLLDVGISLGSDGTFSLSTSKLEAALTSDPTGVKGLFSMLGQTFAMSGESSDASVEYVTASSDTAPGEYAINVTQAATQSILNGGTLGSLTVDADNDVFRFEVDGVETGDITLTQGTYANGDDLATEIQTQLDADTALQDAGASLTVTYDSGANELVFTSASYGTTSHVAITQAESGASALGMDVASGTAGLDVAGTIGGETATGKGQVLTATVGDAAGLQVRITDATTGDRGTLSLTSGSTAGVAYVMATDDTLAGEYAIEVTQAATQGTLAGAATSSLTVDGDNNTLQVTVDGVSSKTISLTQATYASGDDLAAEIQSRINGDSNLKAAGVSVAVEYDTDHFTLTSSSYGSDSEVSITQVGPAGPATLGLWVGSGIAGLDVAGTINGEAATGKGQFLTSSSGASKGLQLLIADSQTGNRGTVSFSRGLMDSLNNLLDNILDSKDGTIAARSTSLNDALTQNAADQKTLDTRMNALEARLYVQFNAMDAMVATLQSTSDYLTQSLASLPFTNKQSNA